MLPLFFNGLLSYLIGMKRRTSRCFTCKRDNSYFLCYLENLSIMPLGIFLFLLIKHIKNKDIIYSKPPRQLYTKYKNCTYFVKVHFYRFFWWNTRQSIVNICYLLISYRCLQHQNEWIQQQQQDYDKITWELWKTLYPMSELLHCLQIY